MNLLITGAAHPTEERLNHLRALGHTVWCLPQERDALPLPTEEVEGVVANGLFLHHDISDFRNLKYIQLTSAGLDRVPLDYIRAHGIALHNAAGVYSAPMAEFAVAAALYIYKQLAFFTANQHTRTFEKHRGLRELGGKRVCILGCGNVGTACAARFAAFGCRVTGVDISPRDDDRFSSVLPLEQLHTVLKDTDILLLTLPLTEATHHIIGAKELALLKDGALLINIARGGVVDTAALTKVLADRPLYAILDVFEEEPLPTDSPLWGCERVLLTPHNSFVGEQNDDRLWALIQSNLEGSDDR